MSEECNAIAGPSTNVPVLTRSASQGSSSVRKRKCDNNTENGSDADVPQMKKLKTDIAPDALNENTPQEAETQMEVDFVCNNDSSFPENAPIDMDMDGIKTAEEAVNTQKSSVRPKHSSSKHNKKKSHSSKSSPPSMKRVFSVQQDAENLARVLNIDNVDLLYAKLEKKRTFMNRVDIVTNEVLDLNPSVDHDTELDKDVEIMRTLFPDCDPTFLRESLNAKPYDLHRVQNLSLELFEDKSYPKLKEREEKERLTALREKLLKQVFNLEEFMQAFPDPESYFCDSSRSINENYKQHAKIQLQNMFPLVHTSVIKRALTGSRGRFTRAYRDLLAGSYDAPVTRRAAKRVPVAVERDKVEMPEVPHEYFYNELLFALHEKDIRSYIKQKRAEKKQRHREAKEKGELFCCDCCCDDEVLAEDMLPCEEGHLFCVTCIRNSVEELIGQAKVRFPCLSGDGDCNYPSTTLEAILPEKLYSALMRRMQEVEIQEAGIEDLVSCPFCTFASIMPNKDDKVFHCLNPECLRDSCRMCRQVNHVPLSCEELKKVREEDMRHYIESKMSEAMIRVCHKCKNRFYKTEGCNMMTCSCGARMCYLCRKAVTDYSHFRGKNGCASYVDVENLHKNEITQGAEKAKDAYIDEHPEAADTPMTYDPLQEFNKLMEGAQT